MEGEDQICRIAQEVKDAGGVMLRGGAYKPRTSPYAFQGLESEGIPGYGRSEENAQDCQLSVN